LWYDPAGDAGGATPTILSTSAGASGYFRYINEHRASDGVFLRGYDLGANNDAWGVVRVGSSLFVLWSPDDTIGGTWYITKVSQSTLAFQAQAAVQSTINNLNPGLATDGTNLFVVSTAGTGLAQRIKLFCWTTAIARSSGNDLTLDSGFTVNATSTLGPRCELSGAVKLTEAGINGGAAVWWVSVYDPYAGSGKDRVYAFSASTGNRVTGYDWGAGTDGGAVDGVAHDGTNFRTLVLNSDVYTHTGWKWDTGATSDQLWVAFTWYDSAGTVHETTLSPISNITMRQRAGLSVSWPLIPTGGADDADSVRVYLKQQASTPGTTFANYYKQGTTYTGTQTILSSYSTGTAGSKATDFPAGTPALIESADQTQYLKGDKSAKWDTLMPPGAMLPFGGAAAPGGFLLCDGTSYLRATYPDLFTALGGASSPWGLPDGTHFNVPDMRARFPLGVSGTTPSLAAQGGSGSSHATAGNHVHDNHSAAVNDHATAANTTVTGSGNRTTGFAHGGVHVGDGGHTHNAHSIANDLIGPYLGVNFIIKY
jgi:microcystin-dependent protein